MNNIQKKPHALLVGNFSNKTGYAWANIYRLYNEIAKVLHENNIAVCLSFASITPPISILDKDIPIKFFLYDPLNVTFSDIRELITSIRKYNIKYVYCTDLKAYHWTYPLMRLMGVKSIVIHNRVSTADPYPAEPETGLKRIIKGILTRINYINADRIYCVSDFTKNRLVYKNCIPEKKVIRILNGINLEKFTCAYLPSREHVSIFVGARATLHKGVHVLIEAAYLLVDGYKVVNFKINYAGDGPDMEYLKSLVEKYNLGCYFKFLGEVKETQRYVCNADIIVVPSIWGDACPSAVSEALAAGKPLITSRAGGIPEIVGDDANAIIIEPGDFHGMAKKLNGLIKSPESRKRYGKNARLRAESALDEKIYYSAVLRQIKSDFQLS